MQTLLSQFSTVLLLAGILLSLLALRKTIRAFNQSRRAPYYILREEAARSAGRWALTAFVLIAATIAILVYASQAPPPQPESLPTSTPTSAVPTLGPTATAQALPTATPPPSPTPLPTATPTLTPTAILAPDVPPVLLTPIANATPVDPAAKFEFLTLSSRLDANSNPIDPGLQFPVGTLRVNVFFRATSVNDGAVWGLFCYRDGAIVDLFVGLWDDGPIQQTSKAFCTLDGQAGTYRVQAYLATTLAFEVTFSLVGEPSTATP